MPKISSDARPIRALRKRRSISKRVRRTFDRVFNATFLFAIPIAFFYVLYAMSESVKHR